MLVIGGGAAGVLTAATVLRSAAARPHEPGVEVTVVERAEVAGPGLAYGTTEPILLLNNYAARMSAVEEDPNHLVRWCRAEGMDVSGSTFLPRRTYGRYLAALLPDHPVPEGSSVAVVRDDIVDLTDAGSTYLATTASGAVLSADVVVLALGNPPPRRPNGLPAGGRQVLDPWASGLVDQIGQDDRVLLVGTGLTTVDVVAQIAAARPRARLTATSRHGLLPLPHLPEPPAPAGTFNGDLRSVRSALVELRRCRDAGAEWRCVVEALKAVVNDVWGALSLEEREQFTRHVSRHWEIARHRMAPAMAQVVNDLVASGRLVITPSDRLDDAWFDVVVNCTGPAPVSTPGWNPLVDRLAVKGMLWPGPLGLGVDIDADGALVDAHGVTARGMYAVGAARRGVEWEVAAVPDIRRQTVRLADHLAAARSRVPVELAG